MVPLKKVLKIILMHPMEWITKGYKGNRWSTKELR